MTVVVYFYRCELSGAPRQLLGQEMKWVRREELAALDCPPADEELTRMLRHG